MSAIYDVDGNALDIGGHDDAYYEEIAKSKLTGKVMVCIGDSYTVGMSSQLSAIATKYGMAIDNRGKVSATISMRSSDSSRRMVNIVNAAISDYTSGYAIGGATYHADDVGVIHFMGGANDGAAIAAWIGAQGENTTDNTTIYGALNYMFNKLLTTFTAAKIIVTTQPANYAIAVSSVSSDSYAQELGFKDLAAVRVFDDYQLSNALHGNKEKAVKDSAWYYGLHIVDMFTEFPSMFVASNRSTYWQNDKLHLTPAGYDIVAKAVEKKIVSLFSAV